MFLGNKHVTKYNEVHQIRNVHQQTVIPGEGIFNNIR